MGCGRSTHVIDSRESNVDKKVGSASLVDQTSNKEGGKVGASTKTDHSDGNVGKKVGSTPGTDHISGNDGKKNVTVSVINQASSHVGKIVTPSLVDQYVRVDAHALKAPQSVCSSTEQLAKFLSHDLSDPVLIARACYRWITDNISYDTDSFFGKNKNEVDSASVLSLRTSVCGGYANLFSDLCKHVGITVKTISGYSKGYGYSPLSTITYKHKTNHAWNAVKMNNKWQFIECTWGSGYLDDAGRFQKEFDDFYFLTDPKHFINEHFPYVEDNIDESKKWQLLDKPWDIEEFNKAVKLSKFAMKWGLNFSHEEAVISVIKTIDIKIEDPRKILIDMTADLQSAGGNRENQDRYFFLRREKPGVYIATVKPPSVGTFRLRFYGKAEKEKKMLDHLVMYILNCTKSDPQIRPYPKHSGLWGAEQSALNSGFDQTVVSPIFYKAEKGQLFLNLKTNRQISAMLQLQASSDPDDFEKYTLLQTDDAGLKVSVRLPKPDYYSLQVLCETDGSGQYYPHITYLIESDFDPKNSLPPFPVTYPNTQEYCCELIEPLDGILPAKREIRFKLRSQKLVKAKVGNEKMINTNGVWETKVTTPLAGEKLKISGNVTDENLYWGLYTFGIV